MKKIKKGATIQDNLRASRLVKNAGLKTYGFFKGCYLSFKRIFSCHPIKFLGGGEGFDPINKNTKVKK